MVFEQDFNVKHVGETYDINEFLKNHPGGVNYVKPYKEKEVTKRMVDTQHSNAAFYLLREYKIGGRNERSTEFNEDLEVSTCDFGEISMAEKNKVQYIVPTLSPESIELN